MEGGSWNLNAAKIQGWSSEHKGIKGGKQARDNFPFIKNQVNMNMTKWESAESAEINVFLSKQ